MQGGNWATHQTCCNDFVIKDVTITGAQLRNIRVAGYAAALLSQANVQGRG